VASTVPDWSLDAVIGYGLKGPPRGEEEEAIAYIGDTKAPAISLDNPSGLDVTTGKAPGTHVTAGATLTLALPKAGLDSPSVGDLWLCDIGIPADVYRLAGIDLEGPIFTGSPVIRISPTTA
jgi:NAD(P)H-hydrate epimerase